jgi:uncharacterized protein
MNLPYLLRTLWSLPIILYKLLISPLLPNSCIYYPSCSSYGRQAIMKHGIGKGTILAASRIGRCIGAFYTGGNDPVPEQFSLRQIREAYRSFRSRK